MKYTSTNDYLKSLFGQKIYKIALDGGFTCPNRDGSLDNRGCIFCSEKGSGNFASSRSLTITQQIESGKLRVLPKINQKTNPNPKFLAYFQAFTNTYAPVTKLKELYMEAISHPDIVALSIATRPDCLPKDVIELLEELNQIKPVWVELGLQTIHTGSAEYIRRGYPLSVYDTAVRNLSAINLHIITHVILGLPGESKEDMLSTVKYVISSGSKGIKLQLLHVLENTDLALDYRKGLFETLDFEEYICIIKECIALIPEDMVVHRITGDADKKELIAPMWSADKKRVLNALRNALE